MAIEREVAETVGRYEHDHRDDQELQRLRNFYREMERRGIVIKKAYDLPLIDTIGRTSYRPQMHRS